MCLHDLRCWLHLPRLSLGVSLRQVSPDLHFWSDALEVGWGTHLDCQVASGLWDPQQTALSINARELLAVQLGLFQFRSALRGRTVAVFCVTTTALTYLRKEGGTRSPLLNTLAQEILRWTESLSIRLAPQFLPGSDNVLADALSRPHQLPHTVVSKHDRLSIFEKPLAGSNSFICHLSQSSLFDLLLPFPGFEVSRHGRVSPVLGQPSGLRVPSSGSHSACSRDAPSLQGDGTHSRDSPLGPAPLFLGPGPAFAGSSSVPAVPSRPLALASVSSYLPGSPSAQASCLATLQRFTRAAGFSSTVAEQSSLARRPSSLAVYQVRWSIYRGWCHSIGHSVSRPTWAKVADFLYWLRYTRGLSVSSLRGYRSVLSAVFRFHLPSLSSDPVIRDLLSSFRLSSAERVLRPHAWDLSKVLTYLVSPAFEPLSQASFRALTLTTLFLLALATAKKSLGATGSLFHSHLCGWGCLPFLHPAVCRQVGVAHPFHPSLLLGEVLSRLCGWS